MEFVGSILLWSSVRPTGHFGFKSQFVPLLEFLKFYSLGFSFSSILCCWWKPLIPLRGLGLEIDWWWVALFWPLHTPSCCRFWSRFEKNSVWTHSRKPQQNPMSVHSHKDVNGRYIRIPHLFEVDFSRDKLVVGKPYIPWKCFIFFREER